MRSVSVIVLEPIAVFEFGLAVEVFGVDRSDEGLEPFDFRVCGVEPGRPLATKNADPFTITPQLGLDSVLGHRPGDRGAHAAASPTRTIRPRCSTCCGRRTPTGRPS